MNKQFFIYSENRNDFINGISILKEQHIEIDELFSPIPMDEIQTKQQRKTFIPAHALIFGILGASGGFYLQYWVNIIAYPLNFGGKPLLAIPSFIPVIFECAILCSAVAAAIVFLSKRKENNNENIDKLVSEENYVAAINYSPGLTTIFDKLRADNSFNLTILKSDE